MQPHLQGQERNLYLLPSAQINRSLSSLNQLQLRYQCGDPGFANASGEEVTDEFEMAATDSRYLCYWTQLSSSEVDGQRNWADLVKLVCVLVSSTTLGQECVLKEVPFMNKHALLFDSKLLIVGIYPSAS